MPAPAPVETRPVAEHLMRPQPGVRAFFTRKRKGRGSSTPPPKGPEDVPGYDGNKRPLCDKCHVAPAKWEVKTATGYLYFCRHHFNKHDVALVGRGYHPREL